MIAVIFEVCLSPPDTSSARVVSLEANFKNSLVCSTKSYFGANLGFAHTSVEALSHLPDLLPITGLRRGAGFNEINNSALLAKAQKPPLLA